MFFICVLCKLSNNLRHVLIIPFPEGSHDGFSGQLFLLPVCRG